MKTIDLEKLKLSPHHKVLDVGCGEGRHSISAYIETGAQVTGVDLSATDLETAKNRLKENLEYLDQQPEGEGYCEFQEGDATSLPFEDASFDVVICSEVLEHIPDYSKVLAEINRVLKPNGIMAISVPRAWPEAICWRLSKAYYQAEGGHIRIFNAQQLLSEVEDIGWERFARHWAHALHVPYWWLKCLFWERPDHWSVQRYHKLLVWDLMQRPWVTRAIDFVLNPFMGKSIVMYFTRSESEQP